jgi:endonuclease YncB( thermonuclease family)
MNLKFDRRSSRLVSLLVLIFLARAPGDARAGQIIETKDLPTARVLRVVDGDTLEVNLAGKIARIRLAEIDAPEKAQAWGREAGNALRALVAGREVSLRIVDVDRYGRQVCTVYVEGANVNRALVRDGHAWAYTEYAKDLVVIALEKEARGAGRGLWSLSEEDREAPWSWRRARRNQARPPVTDPRCSKRTCGEMESCEEARFHLEHCGLSRLDGDRDGTPCESLCRSQSREGDGQP